MSNQKSKNQVTNNEAVATENKVTLAKILYQNKADIDEMINTWLPSDLANIATNLFSVCLENIDDLAKLFGSVKETRLSGQLIKTTLLYIDCSYANGKTRQTVVEELVDRYECRHYLRSKMLFGVLVNLIYDGHDNTMYLDEYVEYIIKELKYMFCPQKSYEKPVIEYTKSVILRALYKNAEESEASIITNTMLSLAKTVNKDNVIAFANTMLSLIILQRNKKRVHVTEENGKVIKKSETYNDNDKDLTRIERIVERLAADACEMNLKWEESRAKYK